MNGYVTYDSISKGIFEAALEKISKHQRAIMDKILAADGAEATVEEWKRVDRMRTEIQNLISALECCPPGNQVWMSVVTAQWASSGLLLANKLEA